MARMMLARLKPVLRWASRGHQPKIGEEFLELDAPKARASIRTNKPTEAEGKKLYALLLA